MKQQEYPTTEIQRLKQEPKGLRKVVKVAVILGVIFGVLAGGYLVYVKLLIKSTLHGIRDETITAVDPLPPGQPYNVLVLGSDARNVLDPSQRQEREFSGSSGGHLADTILLIHVPKDQKSATILSFPRDLRVRIPGRTGAHKINSAYGGDREHHINGANLMIETIKAHTGLSIHYYVEINFASFQKIVDAVGGVRLCPKKAYDDRQSGLVLKHAGCQMFDGRLALGYVRMRKSDPRGDFGRIERQQEFIRVLMEKVKSLGFFTQPARLVRTFNAIKKGVRTDYKGLSEGELRSIANKLAGFKQSNVDFRVVPSYADSIDHVSYVIEKTAEAKALYKALLNDTKLPDYGKTGASLPTPSDVSMRILNGTRTDGLAGLYRDKLRKLGFKVKGTSNAPRRDYAKTVIYYNIGLDAKAALVAEQFPGAEIREADEVQSEDIIVIVGADAAARASPSPGG